MGDGSLLVIALFGGFDPPVGGELATMLCSVSGKQIVRLQTFYAPSLKGPPGASSVWIICPSVRNSVPLINKVQYLSLGGHTVTKLGL